MLTYRCIKREKQWDKMYKKYEAIEKGGVKTVEICRNSEFKKKKL